jgi:thiamine biosynthesis lipoprotein
MNAAHRRQNARAPAWRDCNYHKGEPMIVSNMRRMLCLGFGAWALSAGRALAQPQVRIEQTSFALGTTVRVQAVAIEPAIAERACAAALAAIHRVDRLMSLYDAGSDVCRLNRDGSLNRPDPWTLSVLRQTQSLARRTDGAFDVTVQPLWRLFSHHAGRGTLPSAADVDAVRALVSWQWLHLDPVCVRVARPGVAVTLNGIAQGFAADRARDAMRAAGAVAGLVDAGELASLGRAPSGRPWSAEVSVPRYAHHELIVLDGCVATSSDGASSFTADHRHHHIFDPASGWSPSVLSAASVIADTATQADAWSTAIMVGGEALARRALALGEARSVWLVDKHGHAWWVS